MKYWENGFYKEQNELKTRKEISDKRWEELLEGQSNGFKIVTGNDGFPTLEAIDYSPTLESRIQELKQKLKDTDYQAIKYAEGELSQIEYEPMRKQRKIWRDEINLLQSEIKELNQKESAKE